MTLSKIEINFASACDRDKIYSLRHDVYASELHQHPENKSKFIKDKLDEYNTYIIAKLNGKIVGFVSVTPPEKNVYSIDKYFDRADLPFTVDNDLYEIRILTVVEGYRGKPIALALMWGAFRWIQSNGGKNIVAIGRTEFLSMYTKLGFKAMGQQVTSGKVIYELIFGNVNSLNSFILNNHLQLFRKVEQQVLWNLKISFFKPTQCYHGGAFFEAIGSEFDALNKRKDIINADVLDAWFNPSPKVLDELKTHLSWICKTSPPTDCGGMAAKIAEIRGVETENILPGAGSSDLIFMAFQEWLTPKSRVLILDPTYGEYTHVLENVIGCKVDRINLLKSENFVLSTEKLITESKNNYDLIVLVNPNSPTGQYIPKETLEIVLKKIPIETRVWIDETYIEYTGTNQSLEKFAVRRSNIIICKSMSKIYALSGLRSAYLCSSAYQLEKLKAISPPWAVSLPAQIAAVNAMKDPEYYSKCYEETHELRNEFVASLTAITSVEITQTTANFILCHLNPQGPTAAKFVANCRKHGLYVRDISNMGTNIGKHTIRIAIKDRATNQKMLTIMKPLLLKQNEIAEANILTTNN